METDVRTLRVNIVITNWPCVGRHSGSIIEQNEHYYIIILYVFIQLYKMLKMVFMTNFKELLRKIENLIFKSKYLSYLTKRSFGFQRSKENKTERRLNFTSKNCIQCLTPEMLKKN